LASGERWFAFVNLRRVGGERIHGRRQRHDVRAHVAEVGVDHREHAWARDAQVLAAEDLVQETLLEAWLHKHRLRDATKRSQWLSGIARNVCLRWLRKRARDAAHFVDVRMASDDSETLPANLEDSLADEFDFEVELERKELVELLDRAMALLPAETRAVLVKRYVEESPLAELADQLGTNASAVARRRPRGTIST